MGGGRGTCPTLAAAARIHGARDDKEKGEGEQMTFILVVDVTPKKEVFGCARYGQSNFIVL